MAAEKDVDTRARFGVYINNRAAVFLGPEFGLGTLLELARSAEAAGFDFVSVGDSVLAKPRFSPVVTLAAVASVTERVELSTGILQPHLHHLVTLAQEWATLDVVANGRTSLGVGLGTGPRDLVDQELALVGLTRKRRARAFEEAIVVLKRFWQGGPVTFEGSVYRFEDVDIGFGCAQPGGPRVLIACGSYVPREPGFGPNDVYSAETASTFIGPVDRVGRVGDGWITGMATVEEWQSMWGRIVAAGRDAGRDLDHPGFERRLNTFINVGDPATARAEGKAFLEAYNRLPMDEDTLDRFLISGAPEQCAERLQSYVDAGLTSFQLVLGSADQHGQLERIAGEVLPLLRDAPVSSAR